MNLEHHLRSAQELPGVFSLLWYYDKLVMLSLPAEDTKLGGGKKEGDLLIDSELRPLVGSMFSTISGGVSTHQGFKQHLVEEFREEAGMIITPSDLTPLVQGPTHTIQRRNGQGIFHFLSQGYSYEIGDQGLAHVKRSLASEGRSVRIVSMHEALHMDKAQLRPFAFALLNQLQLSQG